jgi:hypothetical protein
MEWIDSNETITGESMVVRLAPVANFCEEKQAFPPRK